MFFVCSFRIVNTIIQSGLAAILTISVSVANTEPPEQFITPKPPSRTMGREPLLQELDYMTWKQDHTFSPERRRPERRKQAKDEETQAAREELLHEIGDQPGDTNCVRNLDKDFVHDQGAEERWKDASRPSL